MSFHDSRPDYIKDQQFLKATGCCHRIPKVKANETQKTTQVTPSPPPDDGNQGQFLETDSPPSGHAESTSTSELSNATWQPSSMENTLATSKEIKAPTAFEEPINETGNRFTRNHSPRSDKDDSNPVLNPNSQDTQVLSTVDQPEVPEERVPVPTICVGMSIIEELDREAAAHALLLVQSSPTLQQQLTGKVNKVSGATEVAEETLLLDATVTEGTAEVTPEEDTVGNR